MHANGNSKESVFNGNDCVEDKFWTGSTGSKQMMNHLPRDHLSSSPCHKRLENRSSSSQLPRIRTMSSATVLRRPITSITRLGPQDLPPTYLVPWLCPHLRASTIQRAPFSSQPCRGYPRDRNRNRGVSAIHRTGPRHRLSVWNDPLPRPVLEPSRRSKYPVDPNHGLWHFFNDKRTALSTPEEEHAHGLCSPWL